ncbi:MAG: glycosyltransferase family 2 protein [Chloroflexi bacterium]|nr:glycosyltransferase family 2 protein [Chloroflexota bacterium]MCL5075272.1 glycosyltransferase family 2 protein [Chloroflexota bacterium]
MTWPNALTINRSLSKAPLDISIVMPVFNEAKTVVPLYHQLREVMEGIGKTYELIAIDDGSTDESFKVLQELHDEDNRVKVIRFRRNFGQTAAFSAGFDYANGEIIITMDADLQNDPRDIPQLLQKMHDGYDVVSGWRSQRQDVYLSRVLPSKIANLVISQVTGVWLHDYGCSLKAYRREVIKNIRLYGEMHRFIPALASWMGVRVAEVDVHHSPRRFGKSNYGLSRTIKVILDLLTVRFLLSYSTKPIQIFGLVGGLCLIAGLGLGIYLAILRLFMNVPIGDRPLLLLSALLAMVGVQIVTMGLLGELVVRTYHESQGKPTYVIREIVD